MTQQPNNALARVDAVTAVDVQDGIKKALTTNSPNPFAMTFEGQVDGKKVVSAYVKKAGRSVILNEVAKKKGGIAKLYSVCVRSALETRDDLAKLLTILPDSMKKDLIAKRADDSRCLTLPDNTALYKFVILFKSGEKWEGEGIANPRNVRNPQLHTRLDEMAETRAFMRCVGRGTADGFINPEQAAGSEGFDDAAERSLLEEEEGFEHDALTLEADPDGSMSFRSSNGDGAAGGYGGQEAYYGASEAHQSEAGSGTSPERASADEGLRGGSGHLRSDSSGDTGEVPTLDDLMALARQAKVMLVALAQDKYGKKLPQLSGAEKIALKDELLRAIGGEG